MEATVRGQRPPAPGRGDVAHLTSGYSRERAWDHCRCHARPNSRLVAIAQARQVTVSRITCGVVSKAWLGAHVEPCGAAARFQRGGRHHPIGGVLRRSGRRTGGDGGLRRLRAANLAAVKTIWPALRAGQCGQCPQLRRGDGLSGEDGPARCLGHCPLRAGQGHGGDAAVKPAKPAFAGARRPARSGDRGSRSQQAAQECSPRQRCFDIGCGNV